MGDICKQCGFMKNVAFGCYGHEEKLEAKVNPPEPTKSFDSEYFTEFVIKLDDGKGGVRTHSGRNNQDGIITLSLIATKHYDPLIGSFIHKDLSNNRRISNLYFRSKAEAYNDEGDVSILDIEVLVHDQWYYLDLDNFIWVKV